MISKTESGINTYAGHFDQLIAVCKNFGPSYDPVPENLKIGSLMYQLEIVKKSITAVDVAIPAYLVADGERMKKFALLPPLATRVQAAAIVLGLPDAVIVHIKEVVRKIRGQRAHKLEPSPDPNSEPARHISVSQVSFNEQIEHLNRLIALVESQPAYTPAESDLSVDALKTLLDEMRTTNSAVMAAEAPLTNLRQERDKLLYAPKTGMMDTALTVKKYVKAVFGASSPQYRTVNQIQFKNKKI
ncbi:MAG: hypothetical protein LBL57_03700 [Tannerella sp.]|jgi:hypothetical protein|nr:hypothetical protein [Tannerella sp.]